MTKTTDIKFMEFVYVETNYHNPPLVSEYTDRHTFHSISGVSCASMKVPYRFEPPHSDNLSKFIEVFGETSLEPTTSYDKLDM